MAAKSPGAAFPPAGGSYTTVKGGLRRLLRGDDEQQGTVLTIITDVSRRVSALATRALLLTKMYVISCSDEEGIPHIDKSFMLNALLVVGKQTAHGYKSEDRCNLAAFYDTHFKPLLPPGDEPPSCQHLGNVLRYAAANLVAVLETNITQHYVEYVEAYVNAMWGKRATLEWIENLPEEERKRAKATLLATLRAIKTDLLNAKDDAFKSSSDLHTWIHEHRPVTLPAKKRYAEDSVKYDLVCHPQDYLVPMLRMTRAMESEGARIRNVMPLHRSFVPMHVTLDTVTLVKLFHHTGILGTDMTKSEMLASGVGEYQTLVWDALFRTGRRIFHPSKGFEFNHTIQTDGVSCCVLHKRAGTVRRYGSKSKKVKVPAEPYVDELTGEEREALVGRKIVGIDPGMDNLLFESTEDGSETFRYSQAQRRVECKTRKYARIEEDAKKAETVDGKTITEWESLLSEHNFKTLLPDAFRECIRAKLLVYAKVVPFYEQHLWRKMRLNGYYNRQRTETHMLARMRATFGPPSSVVIGIGDWAQRKHRAFKEPHKGKGFRALLRKRGGYHVLLVDEFRTSVQCSRCQTEDATCHKFLRREGEPHLVHGLLLCQQCGRRWKRDQNGAINIARVTRIALEGGPRPDYLSRSNPRKRKRSDTEENQAANNLCRGRRNFPPSGHPE
jgi:hypothetical protein